MKYWRIRHFINGRLKENPGEYLEVGMNSVNFDLIETKRKERIGDLSKVDPEKKYSLIYLREISKKDFPDVMRASYELLSEEGIILVGGYGEKGLNNDAWRVAEGLRKKKIKIDAYRGFLRVFQSGELKGNIRSSMKLENYLKRFDK